MGQLEKLQVKEQIKSSPDKFYSFYRNNMSELADIFPDKFSNVWLVRGKENCVGSVTHWTYVVDGNEVNVNVKIDAIDDENKTLSFNFIEGDAMKFYKSLRPTLKVKKGYAKWYFEFEKAYEDAPDPDVHADFAAQVMVKALDDYLVKN